MKTKTVCAHALMGCLLNTSTLLAAEIPTDTAPTPTLLAIADSANNESHAWVDAGAGCLGGAALGTVLPGIGNIIGCIAGGASVWWLRRAPTR